MRTGTIILIAALLMVIASCGNSTPPPVVQVSATDLYKAFEQDEAAAKKRFEGKSLAIEGEVADTWGAGAPGAKPSVTFKVDSGGIVNCSGELPVVMGMYKKGSRSTVICPASELRYSALNKSIQISGCNVF
jgi:hypothetical protein